MTYDDIFLFFWLLEHADVPQDEVVPPVEATGASVAAAPDGIDREHGVLALLLEGEGQLVSRTDDLVAHCPRVRYGDVRTNDAPDVPDDRVLCESAKLCAASSVPGATIPLEGGSARVTLVCPLRDDVLRGGRRDPEVRPLIVLPPRCALIRSSIHPRLRPFLGLERSEDLVDHPLHNLPLAAQPPQLAVHDDI